ncbi:MAG: hypothetical protein D6747_01710 [Chlorobiota bacterium]|nr:MAG: hypothetical protein D6747_01710 [Chlorobiota bacterium]
MRRWWMSIFSAVLVSASCGSEPNYRLFFEQSGGLGGVPQYQVEIDSLGVCTMAVFFLPGDTIASAWHAACRLERSLYRRLGRMLAHAHTWDSSLNDLQHPDAPIRFFRIRQAGNETQMYFRGPLPPPALEIVAVLDSIVLAARADALRRGNTQHH